MNKDEKKYNYVAQPKVAILVFNDKDMHILMTEDVDRNLNDLRNITIKIQNTKFKDSFFKIDNLIMFTSKDNYNIEIGFKKEKVNSTVSN